MCFRNFFVPFNIKGDIEISFLINNIEISGVSNNNLVGIYRFA